MTQPFGTGSQVTEVFPLVREHMHAEVPFKHEVLNLVRLIKLTLSGRRRLKIAAGQTTGY